MWQDNTVFNSAVGCAVACVVCAVGGVVGGAVGVAGGGDDVLVPSYWRSFQLVDVAGGRGYQSPIWTAICCVIFGWCLMAELMAEGP